MKYIFYMTLAFMVPQRYGIPLINVIVVVIGDNPSYGFHVQAPAYDVLFSDLQRQYPVTFQNVKRHLIYKKGAFTCYEAGVTMLTVAGEIEIMVRQSPGLTILISPGCSLEVTPLGDFARVFGFSEWNVPLLATTSSDVLLSNRVRFPTTVVFSTPDQRNLVAGFLRFFQYFNWRTISLLCDGLGRSPLNLAAFTQPLCLNTDLALKNTGSYVSYTLNFDSTAGIPVNYTRLLLQVRKQSRVVLVITRPSVIRTLMITASRLNMTSGDFVFVHIGPNKVPGLEDITWQYNDSDDKDALGAFPSIIFAGAPQPDWGKLDPFLEMVNNVSNQKYNISLSKDHQRNTLTITPYEAMNALSMVLDMRRNFVSGEIPDGTAFASLFSNRSFELDSREVYISPTGVRASNVLFARMNFTTGTLETAWKFSIVSGALAEVSVSLASSWVSPSGPPADQPVCGFSNERCYDRGIDTLPAAIGSTIAILLIVGPTAGSLYRSQLHHRQHIIRTWWTIVPSDIHHCRSLHCLRSRR